MASSRLAGSLIFIHNAQKGGKEVHGLAILLSLGRWRFGRGHKRRPGLSGFGRVLGSLARDRRDANEMLAGGALDFAPGKLFVTLQMLVALRTGELELVHRALSFESVNRRKMVFDWQWPAHGFFSTITRSMLCVSGLSSRPLALRTFWTRSMANAPVCITCITPGFHGVEKS